MQSRACSSYAEVKPAIDVVNYKLRKIVICDNYYGGNKNLCKSVIICGQKRNLWGLNVKSHWTKC